MEFTIAFVLLSNHCPFYLSLPERELLLEHYVLGSNIFRRGDKCLSKIRYFLSLRHTQQSRTEIHSARVVLFLTLLIYSATNGDTKKSEESTPNSGDICKESNINHNYQPPFAVNVHLKNSIVVGHKLASY